MPQAYHKAAANVLQHIANMLFRSMQRTRATQASREPDSIAHAVLMDKTIANMRPTSMLRTWATQASRVRSDRCRGWRHP